MQLFVIGDFSRQDFRKLFCRRFKGWQSDYNLRIATNTLFLNTMIAKLERTLSNAYLNNDQTQITLKEQM